MGMNKTSCLQQRILRRRRLAIALAGAMAMPPALAQSLPDSGSVVSERRRSRRPAARS